VQLSTMHSITAEGFTHHRNVALMIT